jgi:hypothetical protein
LNNNRKKCHKNNSTQYVVAQIILLDIKKNLPSPPPSLPHLIKHHDGTLQLHPRGLPDRGVEQVGVGREVDGGLGLVQLARHEVGAALVLAALRQEKSIDE